MTFVLSNKRGYYTQRNIFLPELELAVEYENYNAALRRFHSFTNQYQSIMNVQIMTMDEAIVKEIMKL